MDRIVILVVIIVASCTQEVSYGLIDMEASLNSTINRTLQNKSIAEDLVVTAVLGSIRAGHNVNPSLATGNYVVTEGSKVRFRAAETISLEDGFLAEAGSDFVAEIEEFAGDCDVWTVKNKKNGIRKYYGNKNRTDETQKTMEYPNQSLGHHILLYPNPGHGYITMDGETEGFSHIAVLSTIGNLLENIPLSKRQTSFSIEHLPAGVYILTFFADTEPRQTVKYIKL